MGKTAYKIFTTAFLLFALACSPAMPAERFLTTELGFGSKVNTPAGLLEILEDKEVENTFNLVLAGKRVGQINDLASIDGVYPSLQSARLVLIGIGSGSGCPQLYKLVEIKDKGDSIVTDEFGNCNSVGDIHFKQGAWHFRLPGPGNLPSETWVYRSGKVTKH